MEDSKNLTPENSIPFYPDHVKTEFKVVVGIVVIAIILGMLGMFSPVGIGEPADPMNTPAHVKPEWYFLSLYQLLKYIPKTIGAVIPVVLVGLVALWPFLDRKKETDRKPMRNRMIVVAILVVVVIAMTIWGEVS